MLPPPHDQQHHGRAFASLQVHATCLSFLVALEAASAFLERADVRAAERATGREALVLICSSEITSRTVDPHDPHTASLFGDAAAACVLRRSRWNERSSVHAARMETYGEGARLTECRGYGTSLPCIA